MGLLEFSKLPVNPMVGADWKTFNQITEGRVIDHRRQIQEQIQTYKICMPLIVFTQAITGQRI